MGIEIYEAPRRHRDGAGLTGVLFERLVRLWHLGLGVLLDEREDGSGAGLRARGRVDVELVGTGLATDELEGWEGLAICLVDADELIAIEDFDYDTLGVGGAVGDVDLVVGSAVEDDRELGALFACPGREFDVEILDVLVVAHSSKSSLHEFVATLGVDVDSRGEEEQDGKEELCHCGDVVLFYDVVADVLDG